MKYRSPKRIGLLLITIFVLSLTLSVFAVFPLPQPVVAQSPSPNGAKVVQTSNTVVQVNTTTSYVYKTSVGTYSFSKTLPFILNYTGITTSVKVPFATFGVNQTNSILIPCLSSSLCTLQAHIKPYVYTVIYDILSGFTKVGTLNVTYNFQRSIPPKITVTFTTSATNYNIFWIAAGYKVNSTLTSSTTKTTIGIGHKVTLFTSSTDNLGVILNWEDFGNAKVIAWQSSFFGLATYSATLIMFGNNVNKIDPTIVQSNSVVQTGTSASISLTNAVVAGDLLVVAYEGGSNNGIPSVSSISDTLGNSWTTVSSSLSPKDSSGYYFLTYIWYTVSKGGTDTITITLNINTGNDLEVFEVSGLGSNPPVAYGTGSGTGTQLSTSSVSFASGSFLIAAIVGYYSVAAGTGFSILSPYQNSAAEYAASGISSPTTFPATQSGNAAWSEVGAAFQPTPPQVVQPINIPTPAGGSTFTYAVSGCSVSPTSGTSGTTTNFQANPSCTLTITMPSAGTNTRYVFGGSATSTTVSTCSSGTCATFQPADYYQVYNTYSANPSSPTTFSPSITFTVSGTQAGASATICTISVPATPSAGAYSCAGWSDYNTAVSLPFQSGNNPTNVAWVAQSSSTRTFTPTTGGNTYTTNYVEDYTNTYSANPVAPTTFTASITFVVTGTIGGASGQTVCTITIPSSPAAGAYSCTGPSDPSTTVTISQTSGNNPANIRWQVSGTYSWTPTTGGNTFTANYYEQLYNTFQITPVAQTTWDGGLTAQSVIGVYLGTSGSTICTITIPSGGGAVSCAAWSDYNQVVTVGAATIAGAPANSQWIRSGNGQFTPTTGGNTLNVNYYKQWYNTFQITAGGTTFGSGLSLTITGTSLGTTGASICTITPASGATTASCQGYVDNGATATYAATLSGALTNTRWQNGANAASNTPSITSGGNTYNANYYFQLLETWQAGVASYTGSKTAFDAAMTGSVTGQYLGVAGQTICSFTTASGSATASCQGYIDYNQAGTFSTTLGSPPTNEQWKCGSCTTSAQTSGGNTITIYYYAQLYNTYTFTPSSPTTWNANLQGQITGTSLGVTNIVICTATLTSGGGAASCSGYTDYNTAASFPSSITGNGFIWKASGTITFTDTTGGNTHSVSYTLYAAFTIIFNPAPQSSSLSSSNYFTISYTSGGSPATATCYSTCAIQADPSTTVTISASSSASGTFEKWCLQASVTGTCTSVSFTTNTNTPTITYTYYDLINVGVGTSQVGTAPTVPYVVRYTAPPVTATAIYTPALYDIAITPSSTPPTIWAVKGQAIFGQANIAPTVLQKVTATGTGGTLTLAFPLPVNAKSVIIVAIGESGATGITSVTDSLSNSYTLAGNTNNVFIYYTTSGTSGSDTVTITFNGTPSNGAAAVAYEVADLSTSGISFITASGSGTSVSTSPVSYSYDSFLVAVVNWATTSASFTPSGGFSTDYSAAYTGIMSAFGPMPAPSTTTFPATLSASASWYEVGVVFPAPPSDSATTQYALTTETYGLVAYWPFDEATTGTCYSYVFDISHYAYQGTCVNSPSFVVGKYGGALSFNGNNQYVNMGNILSLTRSFTITAWIYPTTSGLTNPTIVSKYNTGLDYQLSLDSSTPYHLRACVGNTCFTSTSTIPLNQWSFVALVVNNGVAVLYVNGVGDTSSIVTPNPSSDNLIVGATSALSNFFAGYIDDLRFYAMPLTPNALSVLFTQPSPVIEQPEFTVGQSITYTYYQETATPIGYAYSDISSVNLVGYWPLDEALSGVCSGTGTVVDASGKGNAGTCVNNPVYVYGKFGSGLSFTASQNQYLQIPSSSSFPTSAITISAWIFLPSATPTNYYNNWFQWGSLYISFTTTNQIDVYANTAHYTTTATMTTGVWHYIVVTWQGTSLNVYLDGNNILATTTTATFGGESGNIIFGNRIDANDMGLTGYLDELAIYNVALTSGQVAAINTHVAPPPPTFQFTSLGATQNIPLPSTIKTVFWLDVGAQWTLPNPITGSNTRWTTTAQVYGSVGTSADPLYLLQIGFTVSYSLIGGGFWNSPIFNYIVNGISQTLTLSGSPQTVYLDDGTPWSVTQSLTPNSTAINNAIERAYLNQAPSGTVTSPQTIVFTYYHQFLVPFAFQIVPSTQLYTGAPTVTVVQFGKSLTQTLTTTPTGIWIDAGTTWKALNPWVSGANSFIPQTSSGQIYAFGSVQNANPVIIYYQLQPRCVGNNPLILMENGCFVGAIFYVYSNLIGTFFAALVVSAFTLALYIKTDNGLLSIFVFLIASFVFGALYPPIFGGLITIAVALVLTYVIYELIRS